MDANDSAKPIDLQGANFDELLAESNLSVGPPGLDKEGGAGGGSEASP